MLPPEKAIVVEAGFTGLLVTLKWVEYYTNLFYKIVFFNLPSRVITIIKIVFVLLLTCWLLLSSPREMT